jgi:hypothetical protein
MALVAADHVGDPFDGFDLCLGPEQDQLQGHSEFGGDERSSANAGFHFAESRWQESLFERFSRQTGFLEFLGDMVRAMSRRDAGDGKALPGVNVKDRKQDAVNFAKELKLTYPIVVDPDAQVGLLYGAWGLPTTYLIGPKGEGLARAWGPAEWYSPAARNLIKDLLDGKR